MSVRTHRTRMLAAAALTVLTMTLTACNSAEGTKDEGAPAGSTTTVPSGGASAGTSTGAGKVAPVDSDSQGSTGSDTAGSGGTTGSKGTSGSSGTSGSTGSTGSSGSNGSTPGSVDSADSAGSATSTPCSPSATRTTATVVSRPLNHMLLTVTNTGSKNCVLVDYPAVKFTDAQSVPPVVEDSIPQAVVTLAPGESGYAGVLLSAADGSGANGYTAKSLEVYFNSSAGSAAQPSLPAKGVYIDSSISVTYWQSDMDAALSW